MFELIMESIYGWGEESTGAMMTVNASIGELQFVTATSSMWTAAASAAAVFRAPPAVMYGAIPMLRSGGIGRCER